jgi:energy-coupling factor transporter ATP-binding protein EcfA2
MGDGQLIRVDENAHYALQQFRHKTGSIMKSTASKAIEEKVEEELGYVPRPENNGEKPEENQETNVNDGIDEMSNRKPEENGSTGVSFNL